MNAYNHASQTNKPEINTSHMINTRENLFHSRIYKTNSRNHKRNTHKHTLKLSLTHTNTHTHIHINRNNVILFKYYRGKFNIIIILNNNKYKKQQKPNHHCILFRYSLIFSHEIDEVRGKFTHSIEIIEISRSKCTFEYQWLRFYRAKAQFKLKYPSLLRGMVYFCSKFEQIYCSLHFV